jgi:hypothetical protein
VLAAGAALAAIPDGNGTIHGCYTAQRHILRVIDTESGAACRQNESAVDWTQAGPAGLQGPQGVQGPQGGQGAAGEAGLTQDSGTMIVSGYAQADPQVGGFSAILSCPQGTKALWGAWDWDIYQSPRPPADMESFPSGDTGWLFAVGASNESKGTSAFLFLGCGVAR